MTIVYIILILLQAGVIVFFIRHNRKKAAQAQPATNIPGTGTYAGTRQLALQVTPQQLKLNIPDTEQLVYGVVMDWDMGDMTTTLAAYITGAASICFSTGGVVTGGGKSPVVGEAAVEFVVTAQQYIERVMPVTITDLPAKGCVRFYFLTNKGMFGAQEQTKHFEDGSSPWLQLFALGSVVVNEVRDGGAAA
ncbi:MAG: hypothetical protein JWQ38_1123 [Flavipsychrobacter sp.]|nr:hypothetical protein [Flavipsychrobacter sp.]